jgi:hypothetical protein
MNKLSSVDHCLDISKPKLKDSSVKTAKTRFQLSYINSNSAIKPELCHRFDLKQIGTDFDKKDSL